MLLELNIVIIIWIARPTNGRPILTYAVVTPATETVTVGVATNGDEGVGVGSVETQPFGPDTLSSSAPSMSPQPTQNVISKSYSLATSATEMPDVRPNATLDSILPLPTPSVDEQVPMDTFIVDGVIINHPARVMIRTPTMDRQNPTAVYYIMPSSTYTTSVNGVGCSPQMITTLIVIASLLGAVVLVLAISSIAFFHLSYKHPKSKTNSDISASQSRVDQFKLGPRITHGQASPLKLESEGTFDSLQSLASPYPSISINSPQSGCFKKSSM